MTHTSPLEPMHDEEWEQLEHRLLHNEGPPVTPRDALRLIATIRVERERIERVRESCAEREQCARQEVDQYLRLKLEAEEAARAMRQRAEEAEAQVPRLRDEIRSLHRELDQRGRRG